MKRCMIVLVALMAMLAFAQEQQSAKISLADARSQIDKVVASPEEMKAMMTQLSAEDQRLFLAEVNKAVCGMPGSVEERTALFLALDHAAVVSAVKGNSAALLAEVFATVPPESLTVINERFAVDLLSRTANPNVNVSDEKYVNIALDVMEKVNARCEETDNGSPRAAFAILTLVRASNGTPTNLVDRLVETLKHEDARDLARNEWIPVALGLDGRDQSYEPLLASADAGRRPDFDAVLVIAGPLYANAVLMDIGGKNTERDMYSHTLTPVLDAVENVLKQQSANFGNDKIGAAGAGGGVIHGAVIEGGGFGDGDTDTRPNPTNPDPKHTGRSPIPQPQPQPQPQPPRPYPFQNY